MEKKVLTLTVSKQWFDMISAGEKTEEYREIKPYWIKQQLCQVDEKGNLLPQEEERISKIKKTLGIK